MTDSTIERQAIRAALALAVASAHGQVADAIADLRDEATQLIGLCMKSEDVSGAIRLWCDDASALVERLLSDGYLPRRPALNATTAILRLRLAVARTSTSEISRTKDASIQVTEKDTIQPIVQPPVVLVGNQKTVMDFITAHPDIRTRDLVDGLSGSLSPRTVKRCLKELLVAGLLYRKEHGDRSVSYRVDSDA